MRCVVISCQTKNVFRPINIHSKCLDKLFYLIAIDNKCETFS